MAFQDRIRQAAGARAGRFLADDARRMILGLTVLVVIVAAVREATEGSGFNPAGFVKQIFGGLVVSVMLMFLAGAAPRFATGLALIGATGVVLANADRFAPAAGRIGTRPPRRTGA